MGIMEGEIMINTLILTKGKTFYDPPPIPPPITKRQLLEIYLAYSAFLNGLKSYIQINEQEGVDAILQKYYERLGEIWEEEKEKIKEIMGKRKIKEALSFITGKLAIEKEDTIKMTRSQLKDIMAEVGDLAREAREEAFHKATTLQFTAEALKDLATKIDWQEKVIDDFKKTALERINHILDIKYGTVREYEDVLKSLFGEIKRKEIAEFNRVVGGYAKDLLDDKIKLDRFHSLMQGAIEEYYPKAYMAGRAEFGGKGLEKVHLNQINKEIEEEKKYLKGFADDISRGKVAGGSIEVRAGMYGDAIGGLYEQGKMSNFEDDPQVSIYWRLGIAEHCDDCIELAAGSPYGVDNPLPTHPGAGDTVCLSNCKCYLEIEKDGRWNGEIG
ncbi:MAG: hypothetical protein ACOYWZ_04535 [Bacillota bacterium]